MLSSTRYAYAGAQTCLWNHIFTLYEYAFVEAGASTALESS